MIFIFHTRKRKKTKKRDRPQAQLEGHIKQYRFKSVIHSQAHWVVEFQEAFHIYCEEAYTSQTARDINFNGEITAK